MAAILSAGIGGPLFGVGVVTGGGDGQASGESLRGWTRSTRAAALLSPASTPDDIDGDSFSNALETAIGTSPANACATNQGGQVDAFPPDLTVDGRVDISDVAALLPYWAVDVNRGWNDPAFGNKDYRKDIAPEPQGDGVIDVTDLVAMLRYWGTTC